MRIKPLLAGLAALILAVIIDFTIPNTPIIVDKIIDTPMVHHAQLTKAPQTVFKPQVALASIEIPTPVATPPVAPAPTPVAPSVYHSDNGYIEYIFQAESGGRLNAVNEIGCIGLGQDCNGALPAACPNWQTDLACQLGFWDNYASVRYGGWANAYAFRSTHNWW